jgi:hypothetical protein
LPRDGADANTVDAVNVYLVPSTRSVRLSRLSLDQVQSPGIGGSSVKIECTFQNPRAPKGSGSKATRKKGTKTLVKLDEGDEVDEEGGMDGMVGMDGMNGSNRSGKGDEDEASRKRGGGRDTVGPKGAKTTDKGTSKSKSKSGSASTSRANGSEKTEDIGLPLQPSSDGGGDDQWEDDEEALREGYGDVDEEEDDWVGGRQVGTWKVHGASVSATGVGVKRNPTGGLGASRSKRTKTAGEDLVGFTGRQRGKGTSPVIVSD